MLPIVLNFQSRNPESKGIIGYLVISGKKKEYKSLFKLKGQLKNLLTLEIIEEGQEIKCIKPKVVNNLLLLQDQNKQNHFIIDSTGNVNKIPIPYA